jgi:hypothetical protein
MWMCSLFEKPELFWDKDRRKGIDMAGVERWLRAMFEGDDSGVETSPKLVGLTDKELAGIQESTVSTRDLAKKYSVEPHVIKASYEALSFWKRGGFNMVFVFPTKRATVFGVHVALDEVDTPAGKSYEPSGLFCPELPRALKGAVSTSPGIKQAVRDQKLGDVKIVAAASALARAADFAGILPTVSRKYLQYADSITVRDFEDREMSMRTTGAEGMGAHAVRALIDEQNATVTPLQEEENMRRLGYECEPMELQAFAWHPWGFDRLTDYDGFRASLPTTWRRDGSF